VSVTSSDSARQSASKWHFVIGMAMSHDDMSGPPLPGSAANSSRLIYKSEYCGDARGGLSHL